MCSGFCSAASYWTAGGAVMLPAVFSLVTFIDNTLPFPKISEGEWRGNRTAKQSCSFGVREGRWVHAEGGGRCSFHLLWKGVHGRRPFVPVA